MLMIDEKQNCCNCVYSAWLKGTHNEMSCRLTNEKIKDKFNHCYKWRDAFEKVNKNEK
jgi:hypothetical protein